MGSVNSWLRYFSKEDEMRRIDIIFNISSSVCISIAIVYLLGWYIFQLDISYWVKPMLLLLVGFIFLAISVVITRQISASSPFGKVISTS